MTRLAIGLALLAALLAAVGYVLARPRWRRERPATDTRQPALHRDRHATVEPLTFDADIWSRGGTGSPWSVTSRADNGTIDPRLLGV